MPKQSHRDSNQASLDRNKLSAINPEKQTALVKEQSQNRRRSDNYHKTRMTSPSLPPPHREQRQQSKITIYN